MTCDWCGHDHDVRAICSQRPASRGVSRRSFIALISAGVAGLALAPTSFSYTTPTFRAPVSIPIWNNWFVNSAVLRSGNGDVHTPFKTIFEAIIAAKQGDRIIIAPDTLGEPLSVGYPVKVTL